MQHGLEFRIHVAARHSAIFAFSLSLLIAEVILRNPRNDLTNCYGACHCCSLYSSTATSNHFPRSHVKRVQINQFLNHKIEINQIDANLSFTTNVDGRKSSAVGVALCSRKKIRNKTTADNKSPEKKGKSCKCSFALSNSQSLYKIAALPRNVKLS
jgi:hypothetical protein